MKNTAIIVGVVVLAILLGTGVYFFTRQSPDPVYVAEDPIPQATSTPTSPASSANPTSTPAKVENKDRTVLGTSIEGRELVAYHFGTGERELLIVGGLHGGYEWGTVLLAYQFIDHLKAQPNVIPANMKVTVIPVANPDGLAKVVGNKDRFTSADVSASKEVQASGRFNANQVDLNRNFACDWKPTGMWQSKRVSGGSAAFSEPESGAIKEYVEGRSLSGVIALFSAGGGVYASYCDGAASTATRSLLAAYAQASKYPSFETYDHYEITGDMTNWLASIGVPAISVLLTTHDNTEWEKNRAGVMAAIAHLAR
jgi:hypothetical protein